MASLFYLPWAIVRDVAGVGIPGAQVYFTQTGTNTKKSVYADSGLVTPHTNPVICDGVGNPPITYLDPTVSYRVRVYDRDAEAGVDTPIKDIDPYVPGIFADATALQPVADDAANSASAATNSAAVAAAAATAAAAAEAAAEAAVVNGNAVLVAIEAAVATSGFTLAQLAASGLPLNVKWWLATGNGTTDDSAAVLAAIAYAKTLAVTGYGYNDGGPAVYFPRGVYNMESTTIDLDFAVELKGDFTGGASGGGSVLKWTGAVTGIRIQGYGTSGATGTGGTTTGGSGSKISGLQLYGGFPGTQSDAHGIHCRGRVTVRDFMIDNFPGEGIASGVTDISSAAGSCNGSHFENGHIQNCRWASKMDGVDSNSCMFLKVDALVNRLGGHFDSSFLGNNYFGCILETNGGVSAFPTRATYSSKVYAVVLGQEAGASTNAPSGTTAHNTWWNYVGASALGGEVAWTSGLTWYFGAPICVDSLNARTKIDGCYVESNQSPLILAGSAKVDGGTVLVAVTGSDGTAWGGYARGGSATMIFNNGVETGGFGSGSIGSYLRGTNYFGPRTGEASASGLIYINRTDGSGEASVYFTFNGTTEGAFVSFGTSMLYRAAVHSFQSVDGGAVFATIDTNGVLAKVPVGYATGAGGAVTQATSKSTAVTLNKVCGQITMHNASLADNTKVSFTLNNSVLAATDTMQVNVGSGAADAAAYTVRAAVTGAGVAKITLKNDGSGGALGEAVVVNFSVLKAVVA
jgi:hypothetical protein